MADTHYRILQPKYLKSGGHKHEQLRIRSLPSRSVSQGKDLKTLSVQFLGITIAIFFTLTIHKLIVWMEIQVYFEIIYFK